MVCIFCIEISSLLVSYTSLPTTMSDHFFCIIGGLFTSHSIGPIQNF
jgi:hypothetical protein